MGQLETGSKSDLTGTRLSDINEFRNNLKMNCQQFSDYMGGSQVDAIESRNFTSTNSERDYEELLNQT